MKKLFLVFILFIVVAVATALICYALSFHFNLQEHAIVKIMGGLFLLGISGSLITFFFYKKSREKIALFFFPAMIVLGIIGITSFHLIGSSIDSQGFIHEPFVFLVLGNFLTIIGSICTITTLVIYAFKKWRVLPTA